ncbi:MAG: hypothetical protein DRP72_00365 [Candidatus Omnitrophota bacterium]|nr:MAG: hypothetical protein DRP72_00365 [Candidatus Omnitrophota bacterium]
MLKIFISYSIKDKKIAGELKRHFESYGAVECFVAHDDIIPGSHWEQEVLRNLESSDFFMPIHTKNIEGSYWCQQEAGFALAKNIKIIPLIPDVNGSDPVGFYAKYQGFKIKLSDLHGSAKQWLIKEGIIHIENSEELEKRIIIFEASNSFYEAGINTKSLFELEREFTTGDILRIVEITLKNNQILYSWEARKYLKPFFMKNVKIISKEQLEEFLKAE